MITNNSQNFSSPVRRIGARVDLYNESALAASFSERDALKSIKIERVGESKFFGFGICQKLNVHLIDKDRELSITTDNSFKVFLTSNEIHENSFFPTFFVTETNRNENTNELSITAYDALYSATAHTVSEVGLKSYTLAEFAASCANILHLSLKIDSLAASSFNLVYEQGANFEGTETLREALNAIAEATQTIFFVNNLGELEFKRLDLNGVSALTIDKAQYITLKSGDNRRLQTISSTTELGDNVSHSISAIGSTQYIRDNPFWDIREDIGQLVINAVEAVGGLTINQFDCKWRGNPLLELGDKISLVTKDNEVVSSYLLNDSIEYNGALSQSSKWEYPNNDAETASNPATLGDRLKQVYAKVDKVNKEIELVSSKTDEMSNDMSELRLTTDGISANVSRVQEQALGALEELTEEVATLTTKINATISPEDIQIQIEKALEQGITKVETTTGFKFDEEGLSVSRSDSEISTTITEDGMLVYRNGETVLKVDNEGVTAEDLHASTFLIIGKNSRFEDYASVRTGCFYVGGNN